MRKLIPILVLLLLAMDARAQSISINYPAAGAVSAGQLVTINSGGAVAPVAAGSIAGVIGVALQGVALPGQTVSIGTNGNFPVSVDNSPSCIPGNQMNISATFAGEATCGSTPSGTQEVGVVASVVSGVVRAAFNISASASQSAGAIAPSSAAISGTLSVGGGLVCSATVPTIASGGGGTIAASVTGSNTCGFSINVGTGTITNPIVLTMPTAPHGWAVHCSDVTSAKSATLFLTDQTASSVTSATIEQFTAAALTSTSWTASDILECTATPN